MPVPAESVGDSGVMSVRAESVGDSGDASASRLELLCYLCEQECGPRVVGTLVCFLCEPRV